MPPCSPAPGKFKIVWKEPSFGFMSLPCDRGSHGAQLLSAFPLRSQTASSPREGPTAPAHRPSQRPHCAGPVASAAPAAGPVPGAASESPGWVGHSGSWPLAGWRPPGSCSCGSSGRPGPGSPTGCGPWRSEPGSYLKCRGEKIDPHFRGRVEVGAYVCGSGGTCANPDHCPIL